MNESVRTIKFTKTIYFISLKTFTMIQNRTDNNKNSLSNRVMIKRNEILEENLPKLIKFLINYLKKLKAINEYENPDKLEDFSPIILTNEEDKHCQTLKYAIDNRNIKNLALTGPNGSGKSSILKTFEHNHPEYKCLNISLATFDEKTLETEKIEYNILKQLFYSVEHKKIPESRFKRIENHTGIWWKTILFTLWLFSIIYFLKIELIENIKKSLHIDFIIKGLDIIYGLFLIAGAFYVLSKVMNFIINFKLTKFKIKETDFENDQDKKTINFENEIDEILYFFEKNPVEIVFIQDIDRFKKNKSEIFIKLREINYLINNYEPIKKGRKITFIYAVTDNIFKENERSKFFDFIIPVIPIINYTSSSSKIIEKLSEDISDGKLSKDFIEDVSLFLNDYRTIKSIYNEYIIYKKILGKVLLNYNDLLAMMIYKNIEPTDFENLNNNQGYVFKAIENSSSLIEDRIKIYDDKINKLTKKIDETKKEKLKNIKELRMIYIFKFFEMISSENNYTIFGFFLNNNKCSVENLLENSYFDLYIKESSIKYYYSSNNYTSSGISFNDIEKSIDKISYSQRLEIIKNSEKDKLNEIKIELAENENKKNELNSKKLFELLDNNNSTEYFGKIHAEIKEINNLKLINYLISKGHLNEDYNHYISYFHPGSITKEDNDFLISLLPSEKALPHNHKLNEIGSLVKKIKKENFSRDAILNFSLIDYLVENNIDANLNLIISLLVKKNEKSIQFIDEYLNQTNEINKLCFFKIIFDKWDNLLNLLINKSNFPDTKIELYISNIFAILDLKTIEKIDKKNVLADYISNLKKLNCLNSKKVNSEILKEFLKSRVVFKSIEYNKEDKDLLNFIYDNILYDLNENMIELFLKFKNKLNIEKLRTSNYTSIINSGCETLIDYVNEYINEYIENVFLKLDNNNNESQESLKLLLENENLSKEFLNESIVQGQFIISDLSTIKSRNIQASLISNNKIESNWSNIISYYKKEKQIDEIIVDYLNKNYNILSHAISISDPDNSVKISFSKDLIKSNISDESFSKLVNCIPYKYEDASEFIEINESKLKSLIEAKKLILSPENYTVIESSYVNLLLFLIEKNSDNFFKNLDDYNLNSPIIIEIIDSNNIKLNQKKLIVEHLPDSILLSSDLLISKLSDFLLDNKSLNVDISQKLLIEIISKANSFDKKISLTNLYFSVIKKDNIRNLLIKIGNPISNLLVGKHSKIENNNQNIKFINHIKEHVVSSINYVEKNKKIDIIPYKNLKI